MLTRSHTQNDQVLQGFSDDRQQVACLGASALGVICCTCRCRVVHEFASWHLIDENQQLLDFRPGHIVGQAPSKAGHQLHHNAGGPRACVSVQIVGKATPEAKER